MISRTQYISSAKSEKVICRTNSITFPSTQTNKQTNKKTYTTKNHCKLLLVDT